MHSILKSAIEHPDLLARIVAKSTGAIGEILVADQLTKRGYKVRATDNNARQSDLLVVSPKRVKFSVEVKTGREKRPTWWVRSCPDPRASDFWVLVSTRHTPPALPNPRTVEMMVLTVEEARAIWRASEWNIKHPENGDLRRHEIPDNAINAWHKLPA